MYAVVKVGMSALPGDWYHCVRSHMTCKFPQQWGSSLQYSVYLLKTQSFICVDDVQGMVW